MSTASAPVRLRPAGEADAPGLAELWARAFPGEPRAQVRLRGLLEGKGPYGGLETCRVAEIGGRFVGGLRIFSLRMSLWGRRVPVLGLASVAVAPERRRRGVGSRMCIEALRSGRDAGVPLSALFPFRTDFYGRLGFVLVGELHRYRFATAALGDGAGAETVIAVPPEARARLLRPFYEGLLDRTHGLIERTPALWDHRLDDEDLVVAVPSEGASGVRDATRVRAIDGYLVAEGFRTRRPERSTLRIRELLARTEEARAALLAWVAAQQDAWPNARHDALPGERFHLRIAHPRMPGVPNARGLWFPSAFLLRGPMLRVLDPTALARHLGLDPEALPGVRDEAIPENDRSGVQGALAIGAWTDRLFAEGWPGCAERRERVRSEASGSGPDPSAAQPAWDPILGERDFRLLDVF